MAEKRKRARRTLDPLRARGDHGTIARLRRSCSDAADILKTMAEQLNADPMTREERRMFARALLRAAKMLEGIVFVSRPRGG